MASQFQLDHDYMEEALALAVAAEQLGEVPVGAIIVQHGQIIGKGHNRVVFDNDPTAHAEVVALRDAAKQIKNYRLVGATLYVTLEPCIMCAGALLNGRLERVVFGARDERFGAAGSQVNLLESPFLNHQCHITAGVLAHRSRTILSSFFAAKR